MGSLADAAQTCLAVSLFQKLTDRAFLDPIDCFFSASVFHINRILSIYCSFHKAQPASSEALFPLFHL